MIDLSTTTMMVEREDGVGLYEACLALCLSLCVCVCALVVKMSP